MSRSLMLTLDTKYAKEDDTSSTTTTTTSPSTIPTTTTSMSNEISNELDYNTLLKQELAQSTVHHYNDNNNDDDNNNLDNSISSNSLVEAQSLHEYVTSSSLLGIRITLISNQRIEYILGACSAVIIFSIIIIMIIVKRRKLSGRSSSCTLLGARGTAHLIVDKQILLENEVLPSSVAFDTTISSSRSARNNFH